MQAVTITLGTPVVYGSESIAQLEFKRPLRGKDLKGLPLELGFEHLLILAGRLCGQPPAVMDLLEGEDVLRAVETVSLFLGTGRRTGENP